MSVLICNANGNLTGAATFAAAEVGAGALQQVRFNHSSSYGAAATGTSPAFTITSGKVIDGVILWVKQDGSVVSNGTFKVDLQKGGVSQASVTVNKTDLPPNAGGSSTNNNSPIFFRFTGTATGDGAANWTLVLTTTGTAGSVYASLRQNVASDLTRIFRTTTAQTPAAGDDLYIMGELTGAGTHTSYTVTMNSTAATVYGNGAVNSTTVAGGLIAVSCYGTLSYGTAASTNYILRINGDLRVNYFGTLNIGAAGAEIPRGSTAVLEFQLVSATGDFGLLAYDGAVVNIAGLSRTSGKNVVKCKLTVDVPSSSAFTTGATTNATSVVNMLDATGTSLLGGALTENATNATHAMFYTGASVTNVTQVATVWMAQGAGPANNRFVRVTLGNNSIFTSVTNGFWADIDLQAGTASAITNIGTGVGASVTVTAQGAGWVIKLTGKVATTLATPSLIMNACSAVGTLSYIGSTSNQNFLFDHVALVTAASIPDTTFNVDTDTGWLNGDVICITSTSRTPTECELYPLNANAGASSFTSVLLPCNMPVVGGVTSGHLGTAPFQAEIGLLTRNVKIRSTSGTLQAYVYCAALATVTASWAEFARLGTSTATKRGIEVDAGAVANPKSFTYCSLHDFFVNGLYSAVASTSLNLVFSNNVTWYIGPAFSMNAIFTNPDWTCDNNLFMRSFGYSVYLNNDVGGVCTNNVACGNTTNYGFYLAETNAAIGTFNNNTAHSGTGGLNIAFAGMSGVISNFTAWRIGTANAAVGVNADSPDVVFTNLTAFGNTTTNFLLTTGDMTVVGGAFSGDTGFATTNGISVTGGSSRIRLDSVDMSGVGTGLAPHTAVDFLFGTNPSMSTVQAVNCKFGAPNIFLKTNWSQNAYIGFEKYNQVAGDHRCEMKYGQIRNDATIFNALAPSMRMTPVNATNKLESAPDTYGVKIPVLNGGTLTVGASYRKAAYAADNGAQYNGNQPRLIVRANHALGITSDTVLATAADTPALANVTFFDPATVSDASLSGGNLVVTITVGGTNSAAKGENAATGKTSGKYFFQVACTTVPVNLFGPAIGIGTFASTYFNMQNNATTGVLMFTQAGNIWAGGVNTGMTLGARSVGDVIDVAIDMDNHLAFFRVAPSGNWNGSGTANPVTGVGGVPIPAGTMVPFITGGNVGTVVGIVLTANFGASAFTSTVPSGFTAGWPANVYDGAWRTLSGTTAAATDDGVLEFIVDCDGTSGWINVDDWTFSGAATTANGLKNWYNGMPVVGGGGGGGGYFSGGFT